MKSYSLSLYFKYFYFTNLRKIIIIKEFLYLLFITSPGRHTHQRILIAVIVLFVLLNNYSLVRVTMRRIDVIVAVVSVVCLCTHSWQ